MLKYIRTLAVTNLYILPLSLAQTFLLAIAWISSLAKRAQSIYLLLSEESPQIFSFWNLRKRRITPYFLLLTFTRNKNLLVIVLLILLIILHKIVLRLDRHFFIWKFYIGAFACSFFQ